MYLDAWHGVCFTALAGYPYVTPREVQHTTRSLDYDDAGLIDFYFLTSVVYIYESPPAQVHKSLGATSVS